jgi:hypothetical protein
MWIYVMDSILGIWFADLEDYNLDILLSHD